MTVAFRPATGGALVLTVNPSDEAAQELLKVVQKAKPEVVVSRVRGFGPPELCTARGQYFSGAAAVLAALSIPLR